MKIGVVVHTNLREQIFTPEDLARLNTLGEVVYTESPTPISTAQAIEILQDCEIGVGSWSTPYPTAELMAGCPHLKLWEHAAGTVKHFFGEHLRGSSLIIGSCKGAIADSVAEVVLGQILLGLRRIYENGEANRKGVADKPHNLKTLAGSTIGVIGASEVGMRVIRYLRMFPCHIVLYDPFCTPKQAEELGVSLKTDLLELCRVSDVVTLHTPDLPTTYHIMSGEQFRAMKDDAVFINSSRGRCVDEVGLIAELEKGRLFAFLDVSYPEPAALDSPLRRLPNVIYNSHIAGPPTVYLGRQAVDDVEAFVNGKQPLCVIREEDLERIA